MRTHLKLYFRWLITALLLFCCPFAVAPTHSAGRSPQKAEEEIKNLIVMIKSQFEDKEPIVGAGIIIGTKDNQLYIATAEHLVSIGNQNARRIDVSFKWLDKPVAATLLKHTGRPLDLAVLIVDNLKESGISIQQLPLDRLGDAESLKRGDPVYSMGNPHGKAWSVNVTPDKISRREGDLFYFESNFIGEGHSGGALLNEQWELVGMILSDQPPNGAAISIDRILAMAREWNFPVGLRNLVIDRMSLSAGGDISCGIADGGVAYCWGDNKNGGLGTGSEITSALPVQVYGKHSFASVSVGGWSTCGLTSRGAAYCWGKNEDGQLGNGSRYDSNVPQPVSKEYIFTSVSVGGNNACGVAIDGAAYCWGSNVYGQLGNGSEIESNIPVAVAGKLKLKIVSAGEIHTCGITTTGSAYCWGSNAQGQLGNGSNNGSTRPVPVSGGLTFISISAGDNQTCGVSTDRRAYCWGKNNHGQLGAGSRTDRNVPVPVSGGLTYKSVSCGRDYTCGITTEGALYCWGWNHVGGINNDLPELATEELKFKTISAGFKHYCGISTDNAIYCLGKSPGNGAPENRGGHFPALVRLPRQ